MDHLAELLDSNKRVVFLTGAGASVHSGIPPYRGASDAVWSNFVKEFATRKTFLLDPLAWWNDFWLATHFKTEYLEAEPNRGHDALAYICRQCPKACVITQNVDGLHTRGSGAINDAQLIEIHGSLHGGFKCIHPECPWVHRIIDFKNDGVNLYACCVDATARPGDANFKLKQAPTCPQCTHPLLPQALLFDEQYSSHPFYEWDAANDWINDACAIVFVGTSFSVGVTGTALEASRKKTPAALFNINLTSMSSDMREVDAKRMRDILGPSEQVLPLLAHVMGQRLGGSGGSSSSSGSSGSSSTEQEWNDFVPIHSVLKRQSSGELIRSRAVTKPHTVPTQPKDDSRKRNGNAITPTTSSTTTTSTPTPTTSATTSNVITFGHRGKRQKRQQHKVHEHAVQQLHDRGFTNAAQVENALRHHGGNVARTLSALVQSREAFPTEVTSSRVSTVTHRRKPLTTKRIDAPGLTLLMSQGLWLVES